MGWFMVLVTVFFILLLSGVFQLFQALWELRKGSDKTLFLRRGIFGVGLIAVALILPVVFFISENTLFHTTVLSNKLQRSVSSAQGSLSAESKKLIKETFTGSSKHWTAVYRVDTKVSGSPETLWIKYNSFQHIPTGTITWSLEMPTESIGGNGILTNTRELMSQGSGFGIPNKNATLIMTVMWDGKLERWKLFDK